MLLPIKKLIGRVSPRAISALMHLKMLGRWPRISHPEDFNEWVLHSIHCTDTSAWVPLADKVKVRDFVAEQGLCDLLIPILGVWDSPDDIDFDALQPPYVLKTNNGSGEVLFVDSKQDIEPERLRRRLHQMLDISYFYAIGEKHYWRISPKVYAEKRLDASKQAFASSSLIDYKIFCFDGEPYIIEVIYDRVAHGAKAEIKGADWTDRTDMLAATGDIRKGDGRATQPASLQAMLDAARKLSQGFPFVRVDLYEVDGRPYFGELTFTPGAGHSRTFTREALIELGNKYKGSYKNTPIKIPK